MTQPAAQPPLSAGDVVALHDRLLATPGWPHTEPASPEGLWAWVQANHRFNCRLWAEEDLARRTTVADAEIAANKRAIDGFNHFQQGDVPCFTCKRHTAARAARSMEQPCNGEL